MITKDQRAVDLASKFNIKIIRENRNSGQTSAVALGISKLMADGATDILQIPGDVPLVTPREIEQVVNQHLPAPSMTIVPARDKKGSNCVICSPPNSVPLQFGNNSFFPHLKVAQNLGITPTIIKLPGLGLDIDTEADLAELIKSRLSTRSREYLTESGIAKRFLKQQKETQPMVETSG